ncbi:hypothetical protein DRB96_42540 [Streptomyces sp. ICC1]|nr:hypothetical protein DRB96_42540 [Streptomyces sp. ICC1]
MLPAGPDPGEVGERPAAAGDHLVWRVRQVLSEGLDVQACEVRVVQEGTPQDLLAPVLRRSRRAVQQLQGLLRAERGRE